MGRASEFFYKELAIDDSAEAKYFAPAVTAYTDYFADIITTPLYMYQSVPVTTNLGTITKYLQLIRSEVLDNGHILGSMCGIDNNGYAWTWGTNGDGNLGDNTTTNNSSPVSVVGDKKFNQIVQKLDSLGNTCCALDYDGYAWCWGGGTFGTIGDNSTNNHSSPVSVIGGNQFVSVTSDNNCFKALDMSGFAWAWGYANNGQLGDNGTDNHSSPVSVVGGLNFVAIDGCFAIDTNNNVWSWGNNSKGQLGDGTITNRSSPVGVLGIGSSGTITQIANQGAYHSLMLTSDGYCWAVGGNASNQLGDGTTTNRSSPVSVMGGKVFTQITLYCDNSGNVSTSYGLDNVGQVWAWGSGANGMLGDGTTTDKTSPTAVKQGTRKFVNLYSSFNTPTVTAVDMDGNLWAWGRIPWITTSDVYTSYPIMFKDFKAQVKKY
jgi:alpha-tubulin suppressor-like RCC1 family protein